jgi:hypothetical protein
MKWPKDCKHIQKLEWDSKISLKERELIFTRVKASRDLKTVFHSEKTQLRFLVKIVENPAHPAFAQYGLYSKKRIPPKTWIVDYLGYVTMQPNPNSDYVLKFTEELSIDAETIGNEARMVNDFRGIESKPNAEFILYFDSNSQNLRIGVFSLLEIKCNVEILVTYGKGFWKNRGLCPSNEF